MPARRTQQPFVAARQSRDVRSLLPTDLSSAQLRRIAPEIRERGFFSARVQLAEFLQTASDGIKQIASGVITAPGEGVDTATLRLQLKEVLQGLNYQPHPDDSGTIKDLRTDRRLNLIIDMGERQAHGYGQFIQGQDPDVLDEFPCQELVRIMDRTQKRDWHARWREAGGEFVGGGRMIARKDDPIWSQISEFGLPYPPFDFGSGMGVVDVSRDEAEALGVIDPGEVTQPQTRGLNDDLEMSVPARDAGLKAALMADVGDVAELDGDVLKWRAR